MFSLLKSLIYILLLEGGCVVTSTYTPRTISSYLHSTSDATGYNASKFSKNISSDNYCSLQNPHCTLRGSNHALDGLRDVCVLWDKSCSGSRALAAQKFMPEYNQKLQENYCFANTAMPVCIASDPPGRISALSAAGNWMRSPQCSAKKSDIWPQTTAPNGSYVDAALEFSNWTCCGPCIHGHLGRVEIYYWQDANADTSCESIIGNNDQLATQGGTKRFGGHIIYDCTSFGPHNIYDN